MTEKRFYNDGKYVMQKGEVYVACNGEHSADVVATALNELLAENGQLKKENEHIETCFKMADSTYHMLLKQYQNIEIALSKYRKENEKLKKELTKLKEWEKYVGDIKREELDRVFKMSIYEIADGFKYYQERIKELENEMKE